MGRRFVLAAWVGLSLLSPAAAQTGGEGPVKAEELPAPLDTLMEALNPSRLQKAFDRRRGASVEQSDKPAVAEFPLSVFVESVRPLGSLKYDNQLNFLNADFTGDAQALRTLTYEYVFADWNAARFELVAPGGRLEALGFGYQHTLRAGERGNWADGFLVLPEVATTGSGFVGGSAFYTAVYKPTRESPWTYSGSVGANRASMANRPIDAAVAPGIGSMGLRMGTGGTAAPKSPAEEEARIWRPFGALNAWYTVNQKVTVGLELDAYAHRQFGEYLVLPIVTYRPTKHFFVQFGAGYYEIGGDPQAAFMVRVNLLNPSSRKPRDE
jgi:hypothetical protein